MTNFVDDDIILPYGGDDCVHVYHRFGIRFARDGLPYELKVLPLRVFAGDKEFEDKINIQADQVYQYQLSGQLPSFIVTKPDFVERTILEASREKWPCLYVLLISAKLSNTYDVVKSAVDNMKVKNVTVLDTRSACVKQGYVILRAMEKVMKTGTLIQEDVDKFSNESTLIFLVPTLEYLYKGGRIGKARLCLVRCWTSSLF